MEHLFCPSYEFKFSQDTLGVFEGWASTYGNVDAGRDKVLPGAFAKTLRESPRVRLLLNHDPNRLVGTADLADADQGLRIRGTLDLEDPSGLGQWVHHKMRRGELSALSIGYSVEKGGARINDDGIRELTDLKLWETSIVTFPMNELAKITDVKDLRTLPPGARILILPRNVEVVSVDSLPTAPDNGRDIRDALARAFGR